MNEAAVFPPGGHKMEPLAGTANSGDVVLL